MLLLQRTTRPAGFGISILTALGTGRRRSRPGAVTMRIPPAGVSRHHGAMTNSHSEIANTAAGAANGVEYAYQDTGGHSEPVPLVLVQHFRGTWTTETRR